MSKIYVVIDMQNDFVTGVLGSKEAQDTIPNICKVLDKAESNDIIIFTKDTHFSNYANTLEGKKLPFAHCLFETEGWEIVPELKKYIKSSPILKTTFGSLDLADYISFAHADEIVLMGVCTDICVVSNALLMRAARPDLKITVISNTCAGSTPTMHEKALDVMKSCHIDIE